MLFGLCTGDVERIRRLPEWGFDYAEVGARTLVPFEGDSAWQARKRELVTMGVPIRGVAGFIPAEARFVGPEADFERLRVYLDTVIGRASEIGVEVYNWGSAPSKSVPPGWPLSKAMEQIERAAHLIADTLDKYGGVCAIEPINPLECNILYYVTDAALVVQSVGRENIRINVDYYHCALQNEPWGHITGSAEWIAHTHTSGPARHFPKPDDPFDHLAFMKVLRQIGYDRKMSFECSRIPDGAEYATEAKAGVAYVRRLWAEAQV